MKVELLVAAGFVAVLAAPAIAQTADTASFTGPRVEVFGGYNHSDPNARGNGGTSPVTSSSTAHKHNGGIAGAQIGYDYPIGDKMIVGAFGSYALKTSGDCGTLQGTNDGCLREGKEWEAGGRLGYKVGNKMLIYGKGAYVNGSIKTTTLTAPGAYQNSSVNRGGWRAGAGAEYALTNHVYIKAEYDFSRYSSFNGTPYGIQNTNLRYENQQVLGGFGVRF